MNFALALSLLCCGLAVVKSNKQRIPVLKSYDPGSCNKETHGKEVLVKDRADEEIILICVKDRSVYRWKPTDGSKETVGEFFNPGISCSHILDKLYEAKNGFYWITLKRLEPVKIYCDMITDGGGFMLIARKNDSITWTAPSNNMTVEPYGQPHWSSSLGDAPILDFRVQMANKEDFEETKAHWSYRLKSKRPLKNLMMISAGCDHRSAGIGNIAYVKDLQTETIVTTSLRCSKFGFAHHPLLKFGWHKMNSCLKKPCPWGFAFLDVVQHQVDYDGGFSFSTKRNISGMEYKATAFVGCDNGYCCGCYGPKGGKNDYCAERCKAINGGMISKTVYTWFWVRSFLPTRLWKKCMDYQVRRYDGKLISYKLVGHSVVPVQGSCSKKSTLIHDGVIIVPDNSTAQKVPAIDGLLQYRKDKQELYVRSNNKWNVLAPEKKIIQEAEEKDRLNLGMINKAMNNIIQGTDRKANFNLGKIKTNEQSINNLENLVKKHNRDLLKIVSSLHNECFGYKWLNESNRNQKYSSRQHICDRDLSGWYRFGGGAGIKIPTSCVSKTRCGTDATGWMNGAHPSTSHSKVTRKVCYNWDGNCCRWSNNIEVVNCGLYFVYKLSRPPVCTLRYCGSYN